jgi:2'-5' RNA ligase
VPWDAPGSTALVVATPEIEPLTGETYSAHSRAGREGMFPHITLLVPFVPDGLLDGAVEARLREVLGRFEPFDYVLARLARFPEAGVLYFAPEPAAPFVELTGALAGEFPDYPPYDGAHDTIVPHATIADSDDPALLDRLEARFEPHVPIAAHAADVTLVQRAADLRWRRRASYPLGSLE